VRTLLERLNIAYSPDDEGGAAGEPLPSAADEGTEVSTDDAIDAAMREVGFNEETDGDDPEQKADNPIKDGGPEEKETKAEAKPKPDKKPEPKEEKEKPKDGDDEKTAKAKDDDGPEDAKEASEDDDFPDDDDPENEGEGHEAVAKVDPPERFSPDAKEVWADTPEPVQHEVSRAMDELNKGLEKYREAAEDYEEFREFHDILKKNGQQFQAVLGNYIGIENLLKKNAYEGMDRIAQNFGTSLREMASNLMQQPLEPREQHYINQIRMLNNTVKQMSETIQRRQALDQQEALNKATAKFEAFAKANPEMNDSNFQDEVSFFYRTGKADTLEEAFTMAAKQLGVEKQPVITAPAEVKADDAEQPKAQTHRVRSQNGSPRRGSNPRKRGSASTVTQSIDDAFSRVGI
jgi:hypothetical protein